MNKTERKKRSPGSAGLPHRAGSAGNRHCPIPVGPRGTVPPSRPRCRGGDQTPAPPAACKARGLREGGARGRAGRPPPRRARGGRGWEAAAPPPRAGGSPPGSGTRCSVAAEPRRGLYKGRRLLTAPSYRPLSKAVGAGPRSGPDSMAGGGMPWEGSSPPASRRPSSSSSSSRTRGDCELVAAGCV